MILIAGLGNPGPEYENSRHNTGWQVADLLQKELEFDDFAPDKKFNSLVSKGTYCGEKIIIIKPLTFMNLSGKAVSAVMGFYKLKPSDLWVVYDDLDLPLGQIRIRKEGGPGTHNGMKSITESIGKGKFPRFRVGIESRGLSAPEGQETSSFVLDAFKKDEQPVSRAANIRMVEALVLALSKNLDEAMNIYNK
jgi:peptidyl-tRNA hydrolase, PTH1 family